jgi:acyl-coenzyme A synthetase/AMP-(fatty) acid ligase
VRTRPLNRLRVLLDRDLTAANAIDRACDWHPDSQLFHPERDSEFSALHGPSISPARLFEFVARFGGLLHEAGLQKGDRVAIIKSNHVDYFFLVLSVIRAGGIAVPINSGMRGPRLERYLAYTGTRIVLTDASTFAAAGIDPTHVPCVHVWAFPTSPPDFPAASIDVDHELERFGTDTPPATVQRDSPVLIAHTSGTTAFPKGVVGTSGTLVAGIKGHYIDEPITTRNRTGIAGHFNHLVYQSGLFASMLSNMAVWTLAPEDARAALRTIERERLNFFFAFPDVYLRMYHEGLDGYDLGTMRIWIATADTSHEVHMQAFCRTGAFLRVLGVPVMRSAFIEVLGSSEVGAGAIRRVRLPFERRRSDRLIGWPTIGGPRVRLADESGRPQRRPGAIGRVEVTGPTVFAGYWDGPTMGVKRREKWTWIGDLAYRDRLRAFHHLDRAVDVVRTRAGPVYTLPIEEVLLQHPSVGEVCVMGLPHPREGEVPVAVVQPSPNARVDPAELLEWATSKSELSTPPADVILIADGGIPRGLTGKILKRELRDRYASWFAGADELADEAGSAAER